MPATSCCRRRRRCARTRRTSRSFEKQRAQLEAQNIKRREEAERLAERVGGLSVVIIRQAGESGSLYGSVSARDISDAATAAGLTINRSQVVLEHPIKTLGLTKVRVVAASGSFDPGDGQRRPQPRGSRTPGARRKGDRPAGGRGRGRAAGSHRRKYLRRRYTGLIHRVLFLRRSRTRRLHARICCRSGLLFPLAGQHGIDLIAEIIELDDLLRPLHPVILLDDRAVRSGQ